MSRRGRFARTFVEPVERFLTKLARLVVTVVAVLVAGIVFVAILAKLPSGQRAGLLTNPAPQSQSVPATLDGSRSEPAVNVTPSLREVIPPCTPVNVAVSALAPENTRGSVVAPAVAAVVPRPVAPAAVEQTPVATLKPVEPIRKSSSPTSRPTTSFKPFPKPVAKVESDRPGYTWVDAHTNQDGTHVKGHWRKLPSKK